MKLSLLLLFLVAISSAFAQTSLQQKNDSVCTLIKKYWAQKNADAIYNMGGDGFKQQLILDKFRESCFNTSNVEFSQILGVRFL